MTSLIRLLGTGTVSMCAMVRYGFSQDPTVRTYQVINLTNKAWILAGMRKTRKRGLFEKPTEFTKEIKKAALFLLKMVATSCLSAGTTYILGRQMTYSVILKQTARDVVESMSLYLVCKVAKSFWKKSRVRDEYQPLKD